MNRLATRLVVVLAASVLSSAAFGQTADHLGCYKVKDPAPRRSLAVTITNAGGMQTCRVKVPAKLGCLGTALPGVAPTGAGASGTVLCYTMRCPRPFPPAADTTDGIGGQRVVTFKKGQLLCAPAGSTPIPTATTTTLAPQACDFDNDSRRCVGTCGNGGRCSAVAAGGACECRTTSCGDADAPECNGFCERDEACVFTLTDCSCVTIP